MPCGPRHVISNFRRESFVSFLPFFLSLVKQIFTCCNDFLGTEMERTISAAILEIIPQESRKKPSRNSATPEASQDNLGANLTDLLSHSK